MTKKPPKSTDEMTIEEMTAEIAAKRSNISQHAQHLRHTDPWSQRSKKDKAKFMEVYYKLYGENKS